MRYIIYGAGGVGGTIGARLHQAGHDVRLIARGRHLKAIQSEGLRFSTPTQDVCLKIPAVGHPAEAQLDANDVVLLCVKSQHSDEALRELYRHADDSIAVVCCQNGVANERMALRRFEHTYAMVVFLPAEHLEPGQVINYAEDSAGWLDVGCYPHGLNSRVTDVASALDSSGFSSRPDANIMRQKYAKLLGNLNNAVQAACGEGSADIARLLRNEALACYAAADIDCMTADEVRARRSVGVNLMDVPGHQRVGGSSLQSLRRGTGDIETDYLNGEIVQLGRLHDLRTPANRVIQRVANRMVRDGLPVGSYSLDQLTELIQRDQ